MAKTQTKALVVKMTQTPSPLSQKQLLFMVQQTPKEHIYHRPGKGGGTWDYVTGVYVKKVLNYCFGWMWDFEVKEHGREGDLVWVLGRLSIKNKTGKVMVVKEQFGRADIKFKRGVKTPLDYGNDLKAATTDALKKCASELGIASDIYGKNEFQQIQKEDKGFIPPQTDEENKEEKQPKEKEAKKLEELKGMLRGKTAKEKIADLKKRTGIILQNTAITEKHASLLIATLLREENKKNGKG